MHHPSPFAYIVVPARPAMVTFVGLLYLMQAGQPSFAENTFPAEPMSDLPAAFRLGSGAMSYPTPLESEGHPHLRSGANVETESSKRLAVIGG